MRDIYLDILNHLETKKHAVIATVINTRGSTPQKPGSSALFSAEGLIAGTVGGGILEGQIQEIARQALIDKITGKYHFILDDTPEGEGAICGGEIDILVDANPDIHIPAFRQMDHTLGSRTPGALVTIMFPGDRMIIQRNWITEADASALDGMVSKAARDQIMQLLRENTRYGFYPLLDPEKQAFVEIIPPLPRLLIAGAGHVGKALSHLGRLLDFEVTVIDDRVEYAHHANLPDARHVIVEDIGLAMRSLKIHRDDYIVIVTRGHLHDAEALKPCIGSVAAYVGMIGSASKVVTMKMTFLTQGWATPEQWDSIFTPIGLEIGSKTVQEIAVSIAAQLVLIRNNKKKAHD